MLEVASLAPRREAPMPGVHIVTDSSSDLTPEDIEGLDVTVVPLTIRFGHEEFTDRANLSVDDFYKRMAVADELPQTACPSPGAFSQAFRSAKEAGAEAVVCVSLSGGLSNTLQSAQTAAADATGVPVQVLDSRSVSSGLGSMVLDAAARAKGGAGLDAVVERLTSLVSRTHVLATLNTLENLKKGGRIGGAKAMLGSMLAIKPIVDITGGEVEEAGKARTRKRALQFLYERMLGAGAIEQVAVMHGGAPDIGDFLELIAARFPRSSLRVGELGAVIGAHGGAEIIGVSWVASA
jgi:DegV family protein with EDD domain